MARQPPVVAEPPPSRPAVTEPVAGSGSAASTRSGHGMYPPMMGGGGGAGGGQTKARPGYLVEDTGYFADDRWFPPAVMGADDVLPDTQDRSGRS